MIEAARHNPFSPEKGMDQQKKYTVFRATQTFN